MSGVGRLDPTSFTADTFTSYLVLGSRSSKVNIKLRVGTCNRESMMLIKNGENQEFYNPFVSKLLMVHIKM